MMENHTIRLAETFPFAWQMRISKSFSELLVDTDAEGKEWGAIVYREGAVFIYLAQSPL